MKTLTPTWAASRPALLALMTLTALGALHTGTAHAAGATASKEEAVAMVKKGVAYFKANGADKAYAEISNAKGSFIDRDLYLVAYTLEGKCVAHGANPKQIGRDLIDLTDIDGKYFVKDRVAMVKAKPAGAWQEYKFTNPVSKKIEPKVMYCEKAGDVAICGGVYP
jgi:signal transduction histidine kinase